MNKANPRKSAATERPSVFEFHDYRVFIRAWIEYRKATEKGFSMRRLARDAGLGTGFLSMVLSRMRKLTHEKLLQLKPHLSLKLVEFQYLELLRVLSDSDSVEVRADALNKLQRHPEYKRQKKQPLESYHYLSHWYYVAIREMAMLKEFRSDPKWIQSRLRERVSLTEIKAALDFLTENNYLKQDAQGNLVATEKQIDCMGGVFRVGLGNFHRQMLGLAAKEIQRSPSDKRMVGGHTFALGPQDYERVKLKIDELIKEMADIDAASSDLSSVYHVAVTAFPLTETSTHSDSLNLRKKKKAS